MCACLHHIILSHHRPSPSLPHQSVSSLTYGPVGRVPVELFTADDVPDAGEPVRQHGEHGHQEGQYDEAVLRVVVKLLH